MVERVWSQPVSTQAISAAYRMFDRRDLLAELEHDSCPLEWAMSLLAEERGGEEDEFFFLVLYHVIGPLLMLVPAPPLSCDDIRRADSPQAIIKLEKEIQKHNPRLSMAISLHLHRFDWPDDRHRRIVLRVLYHTLMAIDLSLRKVIPVCFRKANR